MSTTNEKLPEREVTDCPQCGAASVALVLREPNENPTKLVWCEKGHVVAIWDNLGDAYKRLVFDFDKESSRV